MRLHTFVLFVLVILSLRGHALSREVIIDSCLQRKMAEAYQQCETWNTGFIDPYGKVSASPENEVQLRACRAEANSLLGTRNWQANVLQLCMFEAQQLAGDNGPIGDDGKPAQPADQTTTGSIGNESAMISATETSGGGVGDEFSKRPQSGGRGDGVPSCGPNQIWSPGRRECVAQNQTQQCTGTQTLNASGQCVDNQAGACPQNQTRNSAGQCVNSAQPQSSGCNGPSLAAAEAEVNACLAKQEKARTCCGNPVSCKAELSPDKQQDLQALLQANAFSSGASGSANQIRELSAKNSSVNSGFAAICMTHQNGCTSSCATVASRYEALAQQCSSDPSLSDGYASAATKARNSNIRCQAMNSSAMQMVAQSANDKGTSEDAADKEKDTGDGGGGGFDFADMLKPKDSDSESQKEKTKPKVQEQVVAEATERGTVGAQAPQKSISETDFNVADITTPDGYVSSITNPGTPASVNVVPNGGGAMPGGNSPPPPSAPPKAGGGNFASNRADVFPGGFMPGGYSAPAGTPSNTDIDGTRYKVQATPGGDGSIRTASAFVGMDLKRFLPGREMDPNRRLAGVEGAGEQINGRGVDFFSKISDKMNEKCRLGVLWKCD